MNPQQFSDAVALLKEDIEREIDSIQDDVIRAGLTEDQQDVVMQHTYTRMDALQARWIGKLKSMCN